MSEQRKPPEIPADMKAFNEKVIKDFRATNGKMSGQMEGRGILLLTTTGARTGKERTARPDERDELAKAVPYLAQQQSLTKREIPIVVLERS